jgi:hypothetical protein
MSAFRRLCLLLIAAPLLLAGCVVYDPVPGPYYAPAPYYYAPPPTATFGFYYGDGGGHRHHHHRRHWR